jgi:hypothetical protein
MDNKDTRKASESIASATVSLLDAVDLLSMVNPPKGAANFCVCSFKPLDRSDGYALRGFYEHPSKICLAQNL